MAGPAKNTGQTWPEGLAISLREHFEFHCGRSYKSAKERHRGRATTDEKAGRKVGERVLVRYFEGGQIEKTEPGGADQSIHSEMGC